MRGKCSHLGFVEVRTLKFSILGTKGRDAKIKNTYNSTYMKANNL